MTRCLLLAVALTSCAVEPLEPEHYLEVEMHRGGIDAANPHWVNGYLPPVIDGVMLPLGVFTVRVRTYEPGNVQGASLVPSPVSTCIVKSPVHCDGVECQIEISQPTTGLCKLAVRADTATGVIDACWFNGVFPVNASGHAVMTAAETDEVTDSGCSGARNN
jgi:hypothetical protein